MKSDYLIELNEEAYHSWNLDQDNNSSSNLMGGSHVPGAIDFTDDL